MYRSAVVYLLAAAILGLTVPSAPMATAQDATPIAASPVAAALPCDLTDEVLILAGKDQAPIDAATLLLHNGTLALHCDGRSEIVAEGVERVEPAPWPGALLLTMADGSLQGVNLLTGAQGDLGSASVLSDNIAGPGTLVPAPGTPWLLLPATVELTDWRVVDLRTMASLRLSEEIGGVLPRSRIARFAAALPEAAIIGFPGTPARGQPSSSPLEILGATPPSGGPVGELPSENAALVIDGTLEDTRWTEASFRSFIPSVIGPDGELVAVEQMTDDGLTVRVERIADGEVVAETGIAYGAGDSMALRRDGAGLLHLAADRLDLITWNGEVTTETLLEVAPRQDTPLLELTAAPDVALVGISGPSGESVGYLVDAATGAITEVPGLMRNPFVFAGNRTGEAPQHVLAAAPAGANERQTTFQLVDVATGAVAVESEPVALPPNEAEQLMAALRDQGTLGTVFLPDGHAVVLDAETGASYTIAPPEPGSERAWFHFPSPGGAYLAMSTEADGVVFIRAVTPDAKWFPVPVDSQPDFLLGTSALPEANT